jgi:hypothetical protein
MDDLRTKRSTVPAGSLNTNSSGQTAALPTSICRPTTSIGRPHWAHSELPEHRTVLGPSCFALLVDVRDWEIGSAVRGRMQRATCDLQPCSSTRVGVRAGDRRPARSRRTSRRRIPPRHWHHSRDWDPYHHPPIGETVWYQRDSAVIRGARTQQQRRCGPGCSPTRRRWRCWRSQT